MYAVCGIWSNASANCTAGNQFVGDTVNSDLRQMMLTFDTNFWGSIRVLQAALPLMPTSGTLLHLSMMLPYADAGTWKSVSYCVGAGDF